MGPASFYLVVNVARNVLMPVVTMSEMIAALRATVGKRGISEERHEVVGEGPQVVLGHPSLPHRCPEGGDHLGHRHNGHENVASHVDYKIKGRRSHSCS